MEIWNILCLSLLWYLLKLFWITFVIKWLAYGSRAVSMQLCYSPMFVFVVQFFKLDTKEESTILYMSRCRETHRATSCFISTIWMTFSPKFHYGCKEMLHRLWYVTSGEDLNANQKAMRSQANPIHWTQKNYCFWNFTYSICLSRSKTLPYRSFAKSYKSEVLSKALWPLCSCAAVFMLAPLALHTSHIFLTLGSSWLVQGNVNSVLPIIRDQSNHCLVGPDPYVYVYICVCIIAFIDASVRSASPKSHLQDSSACRCNLQF